jgi:hypothetical protein
MMGMSISRQIRHVHTMQVSQFPSTISMEVSKNCSLITRFIPCEARKTCFVCFKLIETSASITTIDPVHILGRKQNLETER